MAAKRYVLELEIAGQQSDAADAPRGFVLVTQPTAGVAGGESDRFVRIHLDPNGIQVVDAASPAASAIHESATDTTSFGQWRIGHGWRLRLKRVPLEQQELSIADANWATPELRLLDGPGVDSGWSRMVLSTEIGSQCFIGRSRSGTVFVKDAQASGRHICLHRDHAGHTVEHLSRENRTLLNGEKITGIHRLKHGDILEIGQTRLEYLNLAEWVNQNISHAPVETSVVHLDIVEPSPEPAAPAAGIELAPPVLPDEPALQPPLEVSIPQPAQDPEPTEALAAKASSRGLWVWLLLTILIAALGALCWFVFHILMHRAG